MCNCQYDDPHWKAMAKSALGPANNGYYKHYQLSSPGMTGGMFILSNEYGYNQMRHGNNNSSPYNSNIVNFSRLSDAVTHIPYLKKQVETCNHITYDVDACRQGAIAQVSSAIGNYYSDHTHHPYGLSWETGAPMGMAQVPPSDSGSY